MLSSGLALFHSDWINPDSFLWDILNSWLQARPQVLSIRSLSSVKSGRVVIYFSQAFMHHQQAVVSIFFLFRVTMESR